MQKHGMQMVLYQLLNRPEAPATFVDDKNDWGWPPLHIVANGKDRWGSRPTMINRLAFMKADVEAVRGPAEMTPLMAACASGHLAGAEALILCGAHPAKRNLDGTTCWDLAKQCSNEMVQTLQTVAAQKGKGTTGRGRLL